MKHRWFILLLLPLTSWCANTTVLFQPASPTVGPFPTNALTTPTSTQLTGLQISLPLGACTPMSASTDCVNLRLLNQLDGFSLNPRITVCFSGPVTVGTLQPAIYITPIDSPGSPIGIDQVLYYSNSTTNCVYAKPKQVLDQKSRYLLTVNSMVTDPGGTSLNADVNYSTCIKKENSSYCESLSDAIDQLASNKKVVLGNVIGASIFTTMSATNWLEQARAQVNSFFLPGIALPAGFVSTFDLSSVNTITWKPQTGISNMNYDQKLPVNDPKAGPALDGVGRISFGLFLSPIYLEQSGPQVGSIVTTPTSRPISNPNLISPVSYHVFLPASAAPAGGFPLIIYGHGLGDNQFGGPTYAASTWAKKGFATLAMEITGHGYGPLSTAQVALKNGSTFTVLTPGRGVQFSPTAPIGPQDGCILPNAIATRDCSRQTAVDLMALVRTIRDTHGLGLNLNSSKIFYVGQSFGSLYGTTFQAVEPNISGGTLNVGGGTQTDIARLSPIARTIGAAYLASFIPSLINLPPPPPRLPPAFDDEYVFRGQVVADSVPGALPIQDAFEAADWLGMLGDPLSYAAHLKTAPLPGVTPKAILVQFGLGDLEVPNPTESALARAAKLEPSTWVLNSGVAAAIDSTIFGIMDPSRSFPIYPHRFLSNPALFNPVSPPLVTVIGVAAQQQIADFFATGVVSDPNQYLPAELPIPPGTSLFVPMTARFLAPFLDVLNFPPKP